MSGPGRDFGGATQVEESLASVLADLITEAVATPATPADRAEVLAKIIRYGVDAVRWRNEPEGNPHEEHSLEPLVLAVEQHRRRMIEDRER